MDPITCVLAVGATIAAGTALLAAGIAALFSEDDHERQIKQRANHARKRLDQTSREYLRDVDNLLRRQR
jgi:hypothetical protein